MELEPIIENRTNKTVGNQLNKVIEQKTKKAVDSLLNSTIKTVEESHFLDDDEDNMDFDSSMSLDEPVEEIVSTKKLGKQKTEADILREIEEKNKFDIFTDIGDHWQELGQIVRYQIDKNNRMLTKVDHPFSWEKVQEKFGAGHYNIIAKLPSNNNKYLKAQAKVLASPPEESPDYALKNYIEKTKEAPQNQGMNVNEVITMLERKNELAEARAIEADRKAEERILKAEEKARADAKERMELQEKMMDKLSAGNKTSGDMIAQLTPIITILAPLLLKKEAPKDTGIDTMMKIQEMNIKMMENMQKNTEKMFSQLGESIKSIAESRGKSDVEAEFTPFKVMKMIKDAEADGFKRFKELDELAEEKALAREEARGDSNDSGSKDSTVDTLIKSMAPVLGQMLAGGGQQARPQPVVQQPRTVQALPSPVQPRSSLPKRTVVAQPHPERNNGAKVQATEATKNEPSNRNGQEGVQHVEKSPVDGVSKFLRTNINEEITSSPVFAQEENYAPSISTEKDNDNARAIFENLLPVVITSYSTEGMTIEKTAENCIIELERSGINLATVPRDFDEETLTGILTQLPEEYHTLLRGLQNAIIERITTGTR